MKTGQVKRLLKVISTSLFRLRREFRFPGLWQGLTLSQARKRLQ